MLRVGRKISSLAFLSGVYLFMPVCLLLVLSIGNVLAQSCEGSGYDPNNFTPGCYSTNDCPNNQCCWIDVPAVGMCSQGTPRHYSPQCPSGQVLSCGSQTEQYANQGCTAILKCESMFPSTWGARPLPDPCDPAGGGMSASCFKNCSCCPTGTSRSCTNGANYTYTTYSTSSVNTRGNTVWTDPRTCQTHDDAWISSVEVIPGCTNQEGDGLSCPFTTTCKQITCSCNAVGGCSGLTPPTNPSIGATTPTTVVLNWTGGNGGVTQLIRVDTNQSEVMTGCPDGCYLGTSIPRYPLAANSIGLTGLTSGVTYYWRVVELKDASNYLDFGNVCLTSTTQQFTLPYPNSAPFYIDLTMANNVGSTVPWDSGNRNQICKTGFNSSRTVSFSFTLADADGASDIQSARMRWNGTITNLTLGAATGVTRAATATIDYTGVNISSAQPVYVEITDSQSTTGWLQTSYSWKPWNCLVPVSGNMYDSSDSPTGAQCPSGSGFSTPAAAAMNFNYATFTPTSGTAVQIDATSDSAYSGGNITWGKTYTGIPNSDIVGGAVIDRWIDLGVGTTSCGTQQTINDAVVDPYNAAPALQVDFATTMAQTPWFQVSNGGIQAVGTIANRVPITCQQSPSCVMAMAKTNNSLVAAANITNGGCILGNGSCQYGNPNNWYKNSVVLSSADKYDYNYFYDKYFLGFGAGVTLPTNSTMTTVKASGVGGTGVVFVNGDFDVDTNNLLTTGQSLMVVAKGKVTFEGTVDTASGIFVANGGFEMVGTAANKLAIEGMLYSANSSGNINVVRDFTTTLDNNTNPAMVVNYRPDIFFNLPGSLMKVLSGWRQQ